MIRILHRGPDGQVRVDVQLQELAYLLGEATGLLWVDFQAEPVQVCEPILRDVFHFHPLAIDDALKETHIPRVDDWEAYLYLVLHAAVFEEIDGACITTLELDAFLGRKYLVTHHDQPIAAIDRIWTRAGRDDRVLKNGAGRLLYELADDLVAGYMPVIEAVDDAIDRIENEVFERPMPRTQEELFRLKRAVIYLRRIIGPQREVFNRLARDDYDVIEPRNRVYFRDVYDHLVRLHDTSESLRDLVSGAMDTYLSVINNRLSDVMKTLTIITTLFMPISFMASFFGMNFFAPVEPFHLWTSQSALLATVAAMGLIPGLMYWWVRRRGWM